MATIKKVCLALTCCAQVTSQLISIQTSAHKPAAAPQTTQSTPRSTLSALSPALATLGLLGVGVTLFVYGPGWFKTLQKKQSQPAAPALPDQPSRSLSPINVRLQQLHAPAPIAHAGKIISAVAPETLTYHPAPLAEEEYKKAQSQSELEEEPVFVTLSPIEALEYRYKLNQAPNYTDVIAYYRHGRQVFVAIMHKQAGELKIEDLRDLLWFFYLQSVAQNDYAWSDMKHKFWDQGTFMLTGNHEQIETLYTALQQPTLDAYWRMASHFNEYFKAPTIPAHWQLINPLVWYRYSQELYTYLMGHHKGIDSKGLYFPPRTMKTVLFARLNEHKLYLKPEDHGTHDPIDLINHTRDYLVSLAKKKAPQDLLTFAADWNIVTPDTAENFRKEHLTGEIEAQMKQIIERSEKALQHKAAESVSSKKIMSGIKALGMKQVVFKLIDYGTDTTLEKEEPELHNRITTLLQEILKRYRDWERRKGNEIIFTIDDLLNAAAEPPLI